MPVKALSLTSQEAAGQPAGESDASILVSPNIPSQSFNGAVIHMLTFLCISLIEFSDMFRKAIPIPI